MHELSCIYICVLSRESVVRKEERERRERNERESDEREKRERETREKKSAGNKKLSKNELTSTKRPLAGIKGPIRRASPRTIARRNGAASCPSAATYPMAICNKCVT